MTTPSLFAKLKKRGGDCAYPPILRPFAPVASLIHRLMSTVESSPPEEFLPRFGLAAFRPGQREVIETVLSGEDCLCIMPTGGGKSLCYQLPSVARHGTTLVVSPLIALMKDQVDTLTALGLRAAFINSSLDAGEQRMRVQQMAAGGYDLVYIAPERLRNQAFIEATATANVKLLAIDEAHCISEWGHDFRPDYAKLGRFRERLGNPQTIALTATATPPVQRDIIQLLSLRSPRTFITGFSRPNLHFDVREAWGKRQKFDRLFEFLEDTQGCGIIYASTRKRCEEIGEVLAEIKLNREAKVYHAGLDPETRRTVQERFMAGETPIIVATNAFGMGIDKRDLRFVVHFDLPGSLEAYYQEAGRAGRDGGDAHCLLLFNERDREIQEFFIESAYPPKETIAKVYDFLRKQDADPIQLTLQEVKDQLSLDVSSEGVGACEKILEKSEVLERLDSRKNFATVRLSSDLPTLVDLLPTEAKVQRKVMRTLENIVGENRYDDVFVNPARIEAMAEIDSAALLRALRELQKLEAFDYIPPFRGRAIRMKIRDVPFSQLKIDFKELQKRQAAEYQKLDRVISFARSARCRQLEFLEYFGDESQLRCGACDNCGGLHKKTGIAVASTKQIPAQTQPKTAVAADDSASLAIRMALSAVARAGGKVGKTLIVKMLCGSASKEVKKMHFDNLSTFGLLKTWRQDEAAELLDALLRVRLIQQQETTKFRPTVSLTEFGRQVMRGEERADVLPHLSAAVRRRLATMSIDIPEMETPSPKRPAMETPIYESPPRDALVREVVAREKIVHETPVREAVVREGTPLAFIESWPGAEARPRPQADPVVEVPPVVEPPVVAPPIINSEPLRHESSQPSYYWTWHLLKEGYSLETCEQIRGLKREILLDHLLQAVEAGKPIEAEWCLTPDKLKLLDLECRGRRPERLRPLNEALEGKVSPEEIRLYAAARFPAGCTLEPRPVE